MTSLPPPELKDRLRSEGFSRRDALDKAFREDAARRIAGRALDCPELQSLTPVGGYWPIRSEVDSRPLMEALLDRGQELGVRPFGIEAQRILRLEKGHLIVGQDTDGLTRAFSAGLDGLVRLDKDDFVGRPELTWQAESNGQVRLVGLRLDDDSVVPDEGSQLVREGSRICGRVTSSRHSPTLGRTVCLAQVTASLAEPGSKVTVRLVDGRSVSATVTEQLAQVDPEGVRLRG